jgi:hypothetical protein
MRHFVRVDPVLFAFLALFTLASGCGDGGDGSAAEADAGASIDPGTDTGVHSPAIEPDAGGAITPSPDCDRYLGCVAKVQPEAFPLALTTYQPSGPCWEGASAAEKCSQACREALATLNEAYPERPECGGCDPFVDPGCIDYGASCTTDAQCRARVCEAYTDIYGHRGYYEFDGGLCTRRCGRDDACPPNTVCLEQLRYPTQDYPYPEEALVDLRGSRCLIACPAAMPACPEGTRCVSGLADDDVEVAVCLPHLL